MAPKNNYILVDFENVQPKNLALLKGHAVKVFVFVGSNQSKLPFDLAQAMQELGEKGHYIKIDGNGRNALDFHVAFYIGRLSLEHPQGVYHIISRDKGFDPLIAHLKNSFGVTVSRHRDVSEISFLQIRSSVPMEEKIKSITESLAARGHSRPRKQKTLANTISDLFQKRLDDAELDELIDQLQRKKLIEIRNGGKVFYHPPITG